METELTITLDDGHGRARRIAVQSNRLTIGRSADNDLAIEDRGLSRRHAVIEKVDGTVQISDCGSQNGTFVNDSPVIGPTTLRDGDVVSMGSACSLTVHIKASGGGAKAGEKASTESAAPLPAKNFLSTPAIAMACAMMLLVLALIIGLLTRQGDDRAARSQYRGIESNVNENRNGSTSPQTDATPQVDGGITQSISVEQIEKAAVQVMRRVSSDDKPYVFPPNAASALEDIKRKVERYRSSPAFARALDSLSQRGTEIATRARREGIEPYLVIYVALAETGGGNASEDAAAAARQALPRLLSLRTMFGTEMADKSLIIVAAYRMGGGTRKSHPLLQTMRRLVKNPLTERNVWFLYERGGIDEQVYDFVLSFMASGIIAQNPRQFGIESAPLSF